MGSELHAELPGLDEGPVLESWRRTLESGLNAGADMDPPLREINLECSLFRAAQPVLDRIRSEIDDNRLSVMLIDREARMLTTVDGCRDTRETVKGIGALPGAVWVEETTGTNALATPFETRAPMYVVGREHYVDCLKDYSCYGAPIRNPINGRLEGVLDMMCDAGSESALMRSFINTAIAEIRANIKDNLGFRTASVVRAFEEASSHPAALVVALSRSMVLQSPAAAGLLTPRDIAALRELTDDTRTTSRTTLELDRGQEAHLEAEPVGNGDGVLLRLHTRQRPAVPRSVAPVRRLSQRADWVSRFHTSALSGVIVGEPGTGRTVTARQAGQGLRLARIEPATDPSAEETLAEQLSCEAHDLLVIDGIESLSGSARARLGRALTGGRTRILGTYASATAATSPQPIDEELLSLFGTRLDLPSLRSCRAELSDVIAQLAGPGVRFRFTIAAQRVLETYSWPGNLHELSSLLEELAPARGTLIDVPDLPAHLRARSTVKALTPWQQASCDAIINALQVSRGNKAHAAEYLGISRNTLYHHIREYGIIA